MSSIKRDVSGNWRVRWRTPDGQSRSRNFARKEDARAFLTSTDHSLLAGQYVDPAGGKVTFGEFAKTWQVAQPHRESTALVVDSHLRNHMLPAFEKRPIASIRPSEVQAWVTGLGKSLSPSTVQVVVQHFRSIFAAAVADRLIAESPCRSGRQGLRLPSNPPRPVKPLEVEAVLALADAMPDRYRALVHLGAGAGLRAGEALGVTVKQGEVGELDFMRRELHVIHQLVSLPGQPARLDLPKTDWSARTIPLPHFVLDALASHLERYEPGPWGLVFTQESGAPIARNRFGDVWRAAVKRAGLPTSTRYHDLRHTYASALIQHGESVKVVQDRLGHKSATVTLTTYSHLWPNSEDSTRRAIDDLFGDGVSAPCQTADAEQ